MIFLLLFTMFKFFSKSTLPKNTNRARAPQFERARRRWRKQIGPRQGVSSSSCKLHCSWLRCKKSSAPFPFRSCRVKQRFDINWSGFQRQKRTLCLLTLNPLSALTSLLSLHVSARHARVHTCILHGPRYPELWLPKDLLSLWVSTCSPRLSFLLVVSARSP